MRTTTQQALEAALTPHLASRRNSRPEPVSPKREVSIATRAARQTFQLLEMRRALNPVSDRELCKLIAAAEGALLKVQFAAGDRAVLVAA